jgi:hypothetical protein
LTPTRRTDWRSIYFSANHPILGAVFYKMLLTLPQSSGHIYTQLLRRPVVEKGPKRKKFENSAIP